MVQIGKYNVHLYSEYNIDNKNGSKWHLMDLSSWDAEILKKQNFLYLSEKAYIKWYALTHKEYILEKLIMKPQFSKINDFEIKINIII